jgi:hypothetical protein
MNSVEICMIYIRFSAVRSNWRDLSNLITVMNVKMKLFLVYIAWSRIGNAAVQFHSFFTSGLNGGEMLVLDCLWNVMAHARKPDFVFRLNGRVYLNRREGGAFSSVDYWQASCAHQPAGFVLLVQACVLQSCDAYWLPTPFSCFPFTSPSVHHRVPSHYKRSLQPYHFTPGNGTPIPVWWYCRLN